MRTLALILCLPALIAAQDASEVIRRALAQDSASVPRTMDYSYTQNQQLRTRDGNSVKVRESTTWEVTLLEGSPYRRLVARNGQPLPPADRQKEDDKMRQNAEWRKNETDAQKQQRILDWQHHEEHQHEPLHEIPDAFNLRFAADEVVDGQAAYVVEGTPKPGYKPKAKSAFFLPKVKGRFWIAKQTFQAVRIEFETLDTISWGGIVARVSKGTKVSVEMTQVNDVWLLKRILVSGSARVMLVKGYTGELDLTYSGFKKSTAAALPGQAIASNSR
jgi:hypothetical protein